MSKPTWEAKRTEWQSKESKDSEGKANTTAGAGTAQKVSSDSIAAVATLKIKMTHKKISLLFLKAYSTTRLHGSKFPDKNNWLEKCLRKSVSASWLCVDYNHNIILYAEFPKKHL